MKFKLSDRQKIVITAVLGSIFVLYFRDVLNYMGEVFSAIEPLLLGLLVALIVKTPMAFFEEKIFGKTKVRLKIRRLVSILFAYLIFFLAVFFALYILIPQLVLSLSSLVSLLPDFADGFNAFILKVMNMFNSSPETILEVQNMISEGVKQLGEYMVAHLPDFMSIALLAGKKIVSFCFAVVFSAYILFDKEKIKNAFTAFFSKILKRDRAKKVIDLEEDIVTSFSNFFSGQFVEAIILGAMCFSGMIILNLPYAPLVSTIMMATAVIPLIGAIIGIIPSVIIILLASPLQALIFLIFILILQMIEGNIIYPYIVGSKVELPPLVILFAVIAGGNLFGIVGVLISVPTIAVVYKHFMEYLGKKEPNKEDDDNQNEENKEKIKGYVHKE